VFIIILKFYQIKTNKQKGCAPTNIYFSVKILILSICGYKKYIQYLYIIKGNKIIQKVLGAIYTNDGIANRV